MEWALSTSICGVSKVRDVNKVENSYAGVVRGHKVSFGGS